MKKLILLLAVATLGMACEKEVNIDHCHTIEQEDFFRDNNGVLVSEIVTIMVCDEY